MKIRLSWKLFRVMMFNVVLIVGMMVVIMKLLVSIEFQDTSEPMTWSGFKTSRRDCSSIIPFMEVGRCLPRPGEDGEGS